MARRTEFQRAVDKLIPICTAEITTYVPLINVGGGAIESRIFAQRVEQATKRLSKADRHRAVLEAMRTARENNQSAVIKARRRRHALEQVVNREVAGATKQLDKQLEREAVYNMQHKRPIRQLTARVKSK